jgi:hypothetical protein
MGLERRGVKRRDIEHAERASYRRPHGLQGCLACCAGSNVSLRSTANPCPSVLLCNTLRGLIQLPITLRKRAVP